MQTTSDIPDRNPPPDSGDLVLLLVDYQRLIDLEQTLARNDTAADFAYEEAKGRRIALEEQILEKAANLDLAPQRTDEGFIDATALLAVLEPPASPES